MASSTLAAQLQQLREGGAGSKQKTDSFLYDPREAARVDDETVYNVAWNGLLELQQLDARLDALVTADEQVARLFGRQRIHFHRAQVAKSEDAELDAALGKVLDALSGFFLLGATHKVLEFLVRRYEIHRHNVDAVMAAIVSYHESKWFARMVRILHIRNTRWEFLLQVKQSGEPLLRAALVQRARDETSVLTFIFDAATRIGGANPKLISLYTMVTLDLLERETPLREPTLRWLVPQLLTALKATALPELQSSAYMVVTKLASKANLTDKVVATLVKYLLKYAQPGGAQMNALLCVVFVAQSQASFALSAGTVKYLEQIENVADLVSDASASYDAARFVQLLTSFLAKELTSAEDEHCALLLALIASVPAVQDVVEDLVAALISYAKDEQFAPESARVAAISAVLTALSKYYMASVDAAVSTVLQQQHGGPSDKQKKNKKDKALNKFLKSTFGGVANSAHFVPSNTDAATSLALALDHPTEHIRYQALVSLEKQCQKEQKQSADETSAPSSALLASGDVLLRRLLDDSERIVKFVTTSALGELLVRLCPRKKTFGGIVDAVHKWTSKGSHSVTVVEAIVGFGLDNFRKTTASTEFDDRLVTLFVATAARCHDKQSVQLEWKRVAPWIAALTDHPFSAAADRIVQQSGDNTSDPCEEGVAAAEFAKTLAENVQTLLPLCLRWSKASEVNKLPLTPFLVQVLRSARTAASDKESRLAISQALRAILKKELRALYDSADVHAVTPYAVSTAKALCEVADHGLYASARGDFDACVATLLQSPAHLFILFQAELISVFQGALEAELLPTMARLATTTASASDVFTVLFKARALDIVCAALEGAAYADEKETRQVAHVVPVVLMSLADAAQPVRHAAISCLNRWREFSASALEGSNSTSAAVTDLQVLRKAAAFLLDAKKDMAMDANAVHVCCAQYGVERKAESAAFYQLLMEYVSSASSDETVVAVKLLALLSSVKQASFWRQSLDFFQQTLSGYCGARTAASTDLLTSLLGHYLDVDVAAAPEKAAKSESAVAKVSKPFFDALVAILSCESAHVRSYQTLQVFALSHLTREYYERLDEVSQYSLVSRLLRLLMVADEAVATALIACLNVLPIDSAIFVSLLTEAATSTGAADMARLNCILEVLSIKVDGEGASAVEYQHQEQSKRALLSALGAVLALFCAPQQEKAVSEYMFQILFLCLRRVCESGSRVADAETAAEVSKPASKRGKRAPATADPEALVKHTLSCLTRDSTSPATRNEALLFVSALVDLYPTSVLQSLEGVLGFLGAGSVRQDDEYTFHVLETIIQAVVPHLLSSPEREALLSTQRFLGIFVAAFDQIPSAKRSALFEVLVSALGAERHLAYCVALLLQRAAVHPEQREALQQFAHALCLSFDCAVQISSTVKVLRLARDLLPLVVDDADTDTDDVDDDDVDESELPSDASYEPLVVDAPVAQSKVAARQLNASLVAFVASHLHERELHRKILAFQSAMDVGEGESDGAEALQHHYLMLAQVVLLYFRRVAREQAQHAGDGFWPSLATTSMEILAALQQLLSTPGFVAVIGELLRHENSLVRKKAMQLFNERLQSERGALSAGEQLLFVDMLDELDAILRNADGGENSMNVQTALLSVDILARSFAAAHTKRFQAVLPTLVSYVDVDFARASATALHVAGCAFVALSSVCRAVGPVVFPLLPTFFPKLLAGIKHCSSEPTDGAVASNSSSSNSGGGGIKTVLQCLLTALEVFTEKIPQFLAPYLPAVMQTLLAPTLLSPRAANASALLSVDCCLLNLTNHLSLRQLLPSLLGAYDHALRQGDASIEKLLSVVATVVSALDAPALRQHLPSLARFLVTALDVRRVHAAKLADLEAVEDEVLEVFVQLVLKLSEKQLKPLFLKVSEWARQPAAGGRPDLSRRIAFSKLVAKLSERLRGIFVPYYAHVLDFLVAALVDSRAVLARKSSRRAAAASSSSAAAASSDEDEEEEDDFFARDEADDQPPSKKSKLASGESDAQAERAQREALTRLLHATVRALDGCFVHDSDGFMDKERFDLVLAPLVDVLDVLQADRSDATRAFVFERVAAALANLAWAAKSDLLWKPLHYAVLMKSRGDVPAVRLAALKVVEKCYQVIGDEFLAMLPESIPFLAELMEDTDAEVERTCHEVIKLIEDISGESLDQYLTS